MPDGGAQGGGRRSWTSRIVNLTLRTAHLGAMATLSGGVVFDVPAAALRPWGLLTVVTGVGLLMSEASHSRHWLHQGRGVLALAHVAVLAALFAVHAATAAIAAALVVGAVGSHLPRSIRTWSVLHRKTVD